MTTTRTISHSSSSSSSYDPYYPRKNLTYEVAGFASPLNQAISGLSTFIVLHALLTSIFMLLTLTENVVYESYFMAQKSCHIFVTFSATYYAVVAYQKTYLQVTRKTDFMDYRLLLAVLIAFCMLVVDCVFFGKDTVPIIKGCYEDAVPSTYCDTDNKKTAFTAVVGLMAGHIVLDALVVLGCFWVRWADSGDRLYNNVELERTGRR